VAAGQFFGDGKAFAHHRALGGAHRRHGARGEEALQQTWQFIGVKLGALHADGQAEGIKQKPAAQ
jgi:hypothetical protein